MNTKTISLKNTSDVWSSFGRVISDKKSVATIEKRFNRESISVAELIRLDVVKSGVVFGQVLAGGI